MNTLSSSSIDKTYNIYDVWLLKHYISMLKRNALIIIFVSICSASAVLSLSLKPTVVQTETLLRVDNKIRVSNEYISIEAEIEQLKSRQLIQKALENNKRHFKLVIHSTFKKRIEHFLERLVARATPNSSANTYSEPMIAIYDVELFDASLIGQTLSLEITDHNIYTIFSQEGEKLITGKAESTVKNNLLRVRMGELSAPLGLRAAIHFSTPYDLAADISQRLKIRKRGIDKLSGMIEITYNDHDNFFASYLPLILVEEYFSLVSQKSSAGKVIALNRLENEQAEVIRQISNIAVAMENFRKQNNSINLAKESELILEKLVEVESKILTLNQQLRELSVTHTTRHPLIRGLKEQIRLLNEEKHTNAALVAAMPSKQRELLHYRQQLTHLNEVRATNNERIALIKSEIDEVENYAHLINHPYTIHKPYLRRILPATIAGFLFGFTGCAVIIIIRNTLIFVRFTKAQQLPIITHAPLLAELFFNAPPSHDPVAATKDSAYLNTIKELADLAHFEARNNHQYIGITRLSKDGMTSSTIVLNMALTLSKRDNILLIDADIEQAGLTALMKKKNHGGLTDSLLNNIPASPYILEADGSNFAFLPVGRRLGQHSLMIHQDALMSILAPLKQKYDIIIIHYPRLTLNMGFAKAWEDSMPFWVEMQTGNRLKVVAHQTRLMQMDATLSPTGIIMTHANYKSS